MAVLGRFRRHPIRIGPQKTVDGASGRPEHVRQVLGVGISPTTTSTPDSGTFAAAPDSPADAVGSGPLELPPESVMGSSYPDDAVSSAVTTLTET